MCQVIGVCLLLMMVKRSIHAIPKPCDVVCAIIVFILVFIINIYVKIKNKKFVISWIKPIVYAKKLIMFLLKWLFEMTKMTKLLVDMVIWNIEMIETINWHGIIIIIIIIIIIFFILNYGWIQNHIKTLLHSKEIKVLRTCDKLTNLTTTSYGDIYCCCKLSKYIFFNMTHWDPII